MRGGAAAKPPVGTRSRASGVGETYRRIGVWPRDVAKRVAGQAPRSRASGVVCPWRTRLRSSPTIADAFRQDGTPRRPRSWPCHAVWPTPRPRRRTRSPLHAGRAGAQPYHALRRRTPNGEQPNVSENSGNQAFGSARSTAGTPLQGFARAPFLRQKSEERRQSMNKR